MILRTIKKTIWRLRHDEGGSAITEFTIFLPVWIFCFAGIVNLGKIGHATTNTQIQAQQNLWSQLVDMGEFNTDVTEHVNPVSAAATAFTKSKKPRAAHVRVSQTANTTEATVWSAAMGLGGHWGESYERTILLDTAGLAELGEGPHMKPGDLLDDDANPFSFSLVNDSKEGLELPTMGVASIIASVIEGSGSIGAVGAGVRYGVVVGEKVDDTFDVTGFGTINSNSRYDALVPPAAMNGFTADRMPFALARLMAEAEDNYAVALDITDTGWSDSSQNPGDFSFDPDTGREDGEEQAEEQCRQGGWGNDTSACTSCRERGFNTKTACDCADDPDCNP